MAHKCSWCSSDIDALWAFVEEYKKEANRLDDEADQYDRKARAENDRKLFKIADELRGSAEALSEDRLAIMRCIDARS